MQCNQLVLQNSISLENVSRGQGRASYSAAVTVTATHNICSYVNYGWIISSTSALFKWWMTCSWGAQRLSKNPGCPQKWAGLVTYCRIIGSHRAGDKHNAPGLPRFPVPLSEAIPWLQVWAVVARGSHQDSLWRGRPSSVFRILTCLNESLLKTSPLDLIQNNLAKLGWNRL